MDLKDKLDKIREDSFLYRDLVKERDMLIWALHEGGELMESLALSSYGVPPHKSPYAKEAALSDRLKQLTADGGVVDRLVEKYYKRVDAIAEKFGDRSPEVFDAAKDVNRFQTLIIQQELLDDAIWKKVQGAALKDGKLVKKSDKTSVILDASGRVIEEVLYEPARTPSTVGNFNGQSGEVVIKYEYYTKLLKEAKTRYSDFEMDEDAVFTADERGRKVFDDKKMQQFEAMIEVRNKAMKAELARQKKLQAEKNRQQAIEDKEKEREIQEKRKAQQDKQNEEQAKQREEQLARERNQRYLQEASKIKVPSTPFTMRPEIVENIYMRARLLNEVVPLETYLKMFEYDFTSSIGKLWGKYSTFNHVVNSIENVQGRYKNMFAGGR